MSEAPQEIDNQEPTEPTEATAGEATEQPPTEG